jgi:hypothetical protein
MATRIELPKFQALDVNGDPLSGGLVYTYLAGTDTAKTTYTDRDAGTPNDNPVELDSRGEADIYGTGAYKFVLKTSAAVTIWTVDNIYGINETGFTSISDYSGDLDAAITAISTTETTLVIDSTATMSEAVTVPLTCKIKVEKGGSIDQSTFALAINGPFECGNYPVFTGTGVVSFGTTSVKEVFPEWWGANTTPGTTDMTAEIQDAVDSLSAGDLFFHNETYLISSPIIPESSVNFKGVGTIKLADSSDDDMFDFTGTDSNVLFEGLTFDGNGTNQTGSTATNIIHATTKIEGLIVRNCRFLNAPYSSIRLDDALSHEDVIITDNRFMDYYGPSVVVFGATRGVISNNIFDNSGVSPAANGNGISVGVTSSDFSISGNVMKMGEAGAESFGIEIGHSTGRSSRVSITNNVVSCGNYTNNGGISMSYTDQGSVSGNVVHQPVSIGGVEVTYCTIVSVSGNSIRDCTGNGIAVTGDNNTIAVTGNSIDDYDTNGINVSLGLGTQANFYGITVTGNTVVGGNGDGYFSIYVNKSPSYGLVISNNVFYDNSTNGIALRILSDTGATCTGYVITGNSIYDHKQWLSLGGTGTHVGHTITGNSFVTCTTAASIAGTKHTFRDNGPNEQALTGAITVDDLSNVGNIDSSGGAVTATLGDGLYIGQMKTIVMSDASTSSTLSVTNHLTSDPEVFTFADLDDALVLMWTGTEWITIDREGASI